MTSIWQRIRGRSGPDLTCAQVVELVTDYLEDELSAADRARFEQHATPLQNVAKYIPARLPRRFRATKSLFASRDDFIAIQQRLAP